MVIPLEGRQRWLFAALAVFAVAHVGLTTKEFIAGRYATRPELASLQRSIELSPGNAEYRNRLGRYYAFVAADPQAALGAFRTAVDLNSHAARYWFDLASAYQVVGEPAEQRNALEQALRSEPTAPDVAWEAANFFLVEGETDRALRELRVVMENDPSLAPAALQTSWRVRPDADALLRDVIPRRSDALISFVTLLVAQQETDSAIKAWDRLAQTRQKFEPRYLFDFVRYLVLARRPDAALAAWEQTVPILDLAGHLPNPDNAIVNGDFGLEVLNGGFDWTYQLQPGVHMQLDPSDFREGQRSLSIAFEGPGIADAGIQHWIPVRGRETYDFSAYFKAAEFQGAGGVQLVLRDVYTRQPVFSSDFLAGADFWKAVHTRFTTPPDTTLLVLSVERTPARSPIRGKLWLDNFRLSPAGTGSGS